MATTSDYYNLYVANAGSNNVVHFGIAANGVLSPLGTTALTTTPVGVAVNAADTYLYVVSGTTSATLTEYSLSSGTVGAVAAQVSLKLPSYPNDSIIPTGVTVLTNNNNVYVSVYDQTAYNPGGTVSSTANPGWVFGYTIGTGGALTAVSGSPFEAGVKPSAITTDPVSRFVYVTDYASSQLIGYTVQGGGTLNFMVNGPFVAGSQPTSVVVDPRGIFIYVSDSLSSSVSGYNIALPTGTPSSIVNSNSSLVYATDTQPVAIAVEPALGRFVYTVNHLGNSLSGFRLDPNTGVLTATQGTPYPTGSTPTTLAIGPHGNHAVETVTP
jgi:6-phosphogluconolactonase (cycloisomerase 2 family)